MPRYELPLLSEGIAGPDLIALRARQVIGQPHSIGTQIESIWQPLAELRDRPRVRAVKRDIRASQRWTKP